MGSGERGDGMRGARGWSQEREEMGGEIEGPEGGVRRERGDGPGGGVRREKRCEERVG